MEKAIGFYNLALKKIELGDRSQAAAVFDMALAVAEEETAEERGLKAMIAYYAGVNLLKQSEGQWSPSSMRPFTKHEVPIRAQISGRPINFCSRLLDG